jgi:hypothetical protein
MREIRQLTLLVLTLGCAGCPSSDTPDSPPAGDSDPLVTGCEDPQPILSEAGTATGYEQCADGSVNRVSVVAVDKALYEDDLPACAAEPEDAGCHEHADCTEAAEGRCVGLINEFVNYCDCTYLCSLDSDCGADEICLAPEANGTRYRWPRCVPATCTTGADCASGECGVAGSQYQSEVHYALACRNGPEVDACRTDEFCRQSDEPGDVCWPDVDGAWRCERWHPID